MWLRKYEDVEKILNMPEWEDERFQGLLTSNIWANKADVIREKLDLEYWNDDRYVHLLKPSIFGLKVDNIKKGIELSEKYGISEYITNKCLRRNAEELEILIKYMIKNGMPLIVKRKNGKSALDSMLNASNRELKEKYGIDIKKVKKEMEGVDR